jgi:aminopeptidase-like protein
MAMVECGLYRGQVKTQTVVYYWKAMSEWNFKVTWIVLIASASS